jgi:hypothetical protein
MSVTQEALPFADAELDTSEGQELAEFSLAALWAVQARQAHGNKSVYDTFLWDYVGDPQPYSTQIPGITRIDARGRVHSYNDPHERFVGFSPTGHMVTVRRSQVHEDADPAASMMFIASADLRPDTPPEKAITEWHIRKLDHNKALGRMGVGLGFEEPQLVAVGPRLRDTRRPFAATLSGRLGMGAVWRQAYLTLDPNAGHLWRPHQEVEVRLDPLKTLVDEVNELTERYGIELDPAKRDEHLAEIIPISGRRATQALL